MVLTPSIMLTLGALAADFQLPDVVTGQTITLADFADKKALLVLFISRHCPYVQHIKYELAQLGQDTRDRGLGIVAISSNDVMTHPDDAPDSLKEFAEELTLSFPLLFDESQQTAKDYFAACTPDIFLFDQGRRLVYRGQLDDSRPRNDIPVTGKDLRAAIAAVLSDRPVAYDQKPSIGCNIKWKLGNEPVYFKVAVSTPVS
ncbi:MAG: thioredoxin family protein [Leptolyngbya sp. UWPOB_LEPTO1]|uniref:thioredoxin family protein n=1 Tax=Leptolyngbya sp. UWPOB_LEPTO1 TaxID=2815653 RepID=UPI001AC465D4|nr:thioredoxin family protein [Leptolyngbya sp. UWPOB_LEPTO1]MBN8562988.1 thioredoxin family protein [Leptolyngbya sp. UWPOB_LEPTO1]